MVETLEQCREIGEKIKKTEQELLKAVKMAPYGTGRDGLIQKLQELDKTVDRELFVLVAGGYTSGKTSLINALIGEELLPYALPADGAIYEVHYGKEKKVIAYPGKDTQYANNTPFYVKPTIEGIGACRFDAKPQKDCLISSGSKVVIYWPLEILKCGIVLIDTPGLIFDGNYDSLKEYIPLTDAVLYAVNVQWGYRDSDIETLRRFNELGIKNIITINTFNDILNNLRDKDKRLEYDQYVIQKAETYSVLGKEAVHFVCSCAELNNLKNNVESIIQTGFPELRSCINMVLARMNMVPHLDNCLKTLTECASIMKRNPDLGKNVDQQIFRQVQTIRMELSLPACEVIPQAFYVLDQVISGLGPEFIDKYGSQKKELYDKYNNPELHLAVIGNFSCGKSTFLNAVLKQDLLSMDNLPTTALPTYMRWNKDGGAPEIAVEDVRGNRYVLNDKSAKQFIMETEIVLPEEPGAMIDFLTTTSSMIGKLRCVELSFPKEKQYENFCLIDTPGVNPGQEDAREHILETQSILRKEADAAIVLFPALQVYTADFQKFLDENASHLMDDSIFIVTKMDMVRRESEKSKLLTYVKRLLHKNFNLENPAVYGISAGIALECYTGKSKDSEDSRWVEGFETVLENVSVKLQARRQEIIFSRVGDMLRKLIHVVQDEVKQDAKRLETERNSLIQYSLESLGRAYSNLFKEYAQDLDREKKQWEIKIEKIVQNQMSDARERVRKKIDGADNPSQLKRYLKNEIEEDIFEFNNKIVWEVNKEVSTRIDEKNRRFVQHVKNCLIEYQWYAGNAGVFSEQKKERRMNTISPPDNLPQGTSGLISFFFEHVEISTGGAILIGGFIFQLLPLLTAGFVINRMLYPIRRERIKEKTLRELCIFTEKLEKEYLYNLNEQIGQILDGAGSLLECYQEEYKAFFDKKMQEFKQREKALVLEIDKNKMNLHDMELIENLMSEQEKGGIV